MYYMEKREKAAVKDIYLGKQQGLERYLEKGPKNKEKVQHAQKGKGPSVTNNSK